jgi:hypothetical protein
MSNPVEVRLVTSSSFPSGTGSFNYRGEFALVVQNLAFEKRVAVRGSKPCTDPLSGSILAPEAQRRHRTEISNERA